MYLRKLSKYSDGEEGLMMLSDKQWFYFLMCIAINNCILSVIAVSDIRFFNSQLNHE